MEEKKMISVEVCYALPNKQKIVALQVAQGSTVMDAALQSGLDKQFPGLDIEAAKLGLYGKVVSKPAQQQLEDGDRVEIYRPLIADPKAARKTRAAKVKAEKTKK